MFLKVLILKILFLEEILIGEISDSEDSDSGNYVFEGSDFEKIFLKIIILIPKN